MTKCVFRGSAVVLSNQSTRPMSRTCADEAWGVEKSRQSMEKLGRALERLNEALQEEHTSLLD